MPVLNMHPLLDKNDLKVLCQYLFLDVTAKHQQGQDARGLTGTGTNRDVFKKQNNLQYDFIFNI